MPLPASAITATQRHSDNFSDEDTVVSTHTVGLLSLSAQLHHELVVDVGVTHRLEPIAGIDQHFVNVASIEEVESSFATYVQAVCYHNDYSGNLSPQYIISHSSISCGVTVSALVKCRNLSMASWLRKQI